MSRKAAAPPNKPVTIFLVSVRAGYSILRGRKKFSKRRAAVIAKRVKCPESQKWRFQSGYEQENFLHAYPVSLCVLVGALAKGKRADMILLDADPLADIRNTRRINKVWIGGREVNRT